MNHLKLKSGFWGLTSNKKQCSKHKGQDSTIQICSGSKVTGGFSGGQIPSFSDRSTEKERATISFPVSHHDCPDDLSTFHLRMDWKSCCALISATYLDSKGAEISVISTAWDFSSGSETRNSATIRVGPFPAYALYSSDFDNTFFLAGLFLSISPSSCSSWSSSASNSSILVPKIFLLKPRQTENKMRYAIGC